jgi:hypothetical protein
MYVWGFLRIYLGICEVLYSMTLIKKKKPFVETRGSNDCLPYESANVSSVCYEYVS